MDLWGAFSTWEVVDYDGAFFRASGGNAAAFIEKTDVLSKQEQSILSHNHTGTTTTDGNHSHTIGFSFQRYGDENRYDNVINRGSTHTSTDGAHSHSFTTDSTGGDENRPANYTIRVWKRTA